MGASTWEYYVPYEANINAAFLKLCEAVYPEVAKWHPARSEQIAQLENELQRLDALYPHSKQDPHQAEIRESHEEDIVNALERLRTLPEPRTTQERIIELRLICGVDGTGTILDMKGVSTKPGYFEIAPLPNEELISLFNTVQPTKSMIEINKHRLFSLWKIQMGNYIILYTGDQPSEIYFAGSSGD